MLSKFEKQKRELRERLNPYYKDCLEIDAKIDLAYCDGFEAGYNNAILLVSEEEIDRAKSRAVGRAIEARRLMALKVIKKLKIRQSLSARINA